MADLASGVVRATDTLCCSSAEAIGRRRVSGHGALSPSMEALAYELLAARLNFRRGVVTSAATLMLIDEAAAALECTRQRLDAATLVRTAALLEALRRYNRPCTVTSPPPPSLVACAPDAEQRRADELYCSSAGSFSAAAAACTCARDRHPSANCSSLHCTGHGVSLDDGRCHCFAGWAGAECNVCDQTAAYVCVGMRTTAAVSPRGNAVLTLVDPTTRDARLNGSFYASNKTADALPGTAGYDCGCTRNAPLYIGYTSHAAAVDAALAEQRRQAELWAAVAPASSLPPSSQPPPVSSAATTLFVLPSMLMVAAAAAAAALVNA